MSADIRFSASLPPSLASPPLPSSLSQDGGLLTNNPCAIAMHEARLLWGRSTPIQCVISLGTGLYNVERADKPQKKKENNTSLKEKLTKIVASATDTEGVYTRHDYEILCAPTSEE